MVKKNIHSHTCTKCGVVFEAPCSTNHKSWGGIKEQNAGWNCRNVARKYYKHFKENNECLEAFMEHLTKENNKLKESGYNFEFRFTGKQVKTNRIR
jgi:hypothetical protein|tara:strand:+ start:1904 stop:2191 length:288 start_codon:yes stop_codon:yes gene_type:complete